MLLWDESETRGASRQGLGDIEMGTIGWARACAFACAFATVAAATTPAWAIKCSELNASTTTHPATLGPFSVTLNAGDRVVLSDATAAGLTDQLNVGSSSSSFTMPGSTSITVATSGVYSVSANIGISPIIGLATLTCVPAPTNSTTQQSSNNAQIAVSNGLRTLQNYQEWVTKGIWGSFGMTRGGDTASAKPVTREPSARDKAERWRARSVTSARSWRHSHRAMNELPTLPTASCASAAAWRSHA